MSSDNEKTSYVVGFLLRNNDSEVALIEKLKPDWQRGRLNGIGGKIEDGESPYEAMVREFKEETGADVTDWTGFLSLTYPDAQVAFFVSRQPALLHSAEKEKVAWYPSDLQEYNYRLIDNLQWIVPLAKAKDAEFLGLIVK